MKSTAITGLLIFSLNFSFGQEIRSLIGLDPNTGRPGYIWRDTSIISPFTTRKYLTGYNTWGSFNDTARSLFSGTSPISYNSGTGAFSLGTVPIANGGTNNASLSVTAGTIYYGDGTKLVGLAPGTAAQHLTGGTTPSWKDTAVGGTTLSMAAFGATPNANAGTISGGNLTLQPADTTFPGGITASGTQLLKGIKKFYSDSIVIRRSGTLNNGNYLKFDGGTTATPPYIAYFWAGQSSFTTGPSSTSGSDYSISSNTEINGKMRSIGIVNGTTIADMTGIPTPGGAISLQPSGGAHAFINYTYSGAYFGLSAGMDAPTGNYIFYRNPSSRTAFNGTEVYRIVRGTGDFLIGTSTDDTSAIFNTQNSITGSYKGVMPLKMTTSQRLAINSRVTTGTIAGGTGYTNGVHSDLPFTGGTGTGARGSMTVTGGVVTGVIISYRGDGGYLVGDVLTAAVPGGTGFTFTLSALTAIGEGLEVYDTTTHKKYTWDGSAWQAHW